MTRPLVRSSTFEIVTMTRYPGLISGLSRRFADRPDVALLVADRPDVALPVAEPGRAFGPDPGDVIDRPQLRELVVLDGDATRLERIDDRSGRSTSKPGRVCPGGGELLR
jgi:hypothetical protein